MTMTEPQAEAGVADARAQLVEAFTQTASVFEALRTVRTRRMGLGYRIDSGTTERHPVTGREMSQAEGPNRFVSDKPPVPLSEAEIALLAWAACGPNGIVTWDLSMDGGFHELVATSGRTVPYAGNSQGSDLLVMSDDGVVLYRPDPEADAPVEMAEGADRYDAILDWWRTGTRRILDTRPDLDWALRFPGTDGLLMGPYQYNLNRPGSVWFLPVTDNGKIASAMVNAFDYWKAYPVDDFAGMVPAGVGKWVEQGLLQVPTPISMSEQSIFQIEQYPVGAMVQNVRLAAESIGLGHWCFCGFAPDAVLGGLPDVTPGLGFSYEPPNPRSPVASGMIKSSGLEGIFETTLVPSRRYPDGAALVEQWRREKYGPGGWGHDGEDNALRQGHGPWPADKTDAILRHPRAKPAEWVWEAVQAYVDYCVDRYGQWPVTYNPLQAHYGVVVHHLDPDFYDEHYREGYLTRRHREHAARWHPTH